MLNNLARVAPVVNVLHNHIMIMSYAVQFGKLFITLGVGKSWPETACASCARGVTAEQPKTKRPAEAGLRVWLKPKAAADKLSPAGRLSR